MHCLPALFIRWQPYVLIYRESGNFIFRFASSCFSSFSSFFINFVIFHHFASFFINFVIFHHFVGVAIFNFALTEAR